MYFKTSSEYESAVSSSKIQPASYSEVLEAMIIASEVDSECDQFLLRNEYSHIIGNEAGNFIDSAKAFMAKMNNALKNLASKLVSYISTVPTRINNFVMRVTNWFAKSGLENQAKNLVKQQMKFNGDEVEVKSFIGTDFGPLDWTGVLTSDGASNREPEQKAQQQQQQAAQNAQGKRIQARQALLDATKALQAVDNYHNALLKKIASWWAQYKVNRAKVAQAKAQQANQQANQQSQNVAEGIAKLDTETADAIKVSFRDCMLNQFKAYNMFEAIENIKDGITASYFEKQVPTPEQILARIKLITNGTIQKDANAIIAGIKRCQTNIDANVKYTGTIMEQAIANADDYAVSICKTAWSFQREMYSFAIKTIVRTDSAAQHITANIIKYAKAAMACYTKKNTGAPPPNTPTPQDKPNQPPPQNGAPAASNSAEDFSDIFSF